MKEILKLKRINNSSVKELRFLYDSIESHVRASTGINPERFGSLLILLILEKLPESIQLLVSRKLGKDNWDLEEFLICIKDETSARESCQYLKIDKESKRDEYSDSDFENDVKFTSQTLYAGNNNRKGKFCVFCKLTNHWSDQCKTVTDPKSRIDILRENKSCFKCLKVGHIQKNCRVKVKCYKVQIYGQSYGSVHS